MKLKNGIILLMTISLLVACGEEETTSNRPAAGGRGFSGLDAVPVAVELVALGAISSYILKTTNLEAERDVLIQSRVQGQMTSLLVEEGAQVRRGAVLATIDRREYQLAVTEAKVRLETATVDLARNKSLFEENMIAEQMLQTTKAAYEMAETAVERAEINLAYATIRAPFSGVVTHRTCEVGMMVRNNEELFRISDVSPILARIHVPEKEMGRLRVNQRARIQVETQPGVDFQGKVQLISPVVDPLSGTIKVTVEVDDHMGVLRPGMFAEVYIITETHENTRIIPKRALLLETEKDMVFLYNNGHAKRVPIEIGFVDGDKVEVLAGIETGQEIITVGQEGLRDGAAVRIPEPNETQGTSPAIAAGGAGGGFSGAGGGGGMRGMMQNLSEADRAKLQNMTQDERRTFMQTLREQQGQSDAAAAPQQVSRRPSGGEQAAAQPRSGQRAQGASGGRGGGGRMMQNLSDADRAKVENMSQEDRRAFFQARRAQQGNPADGQMRSGGATETAARPPAPTDGSALNPDRIDRTLARLVEMDERIKTAWQARLVQDPGIQHDTGKKAAFLQEMITQLRSAQ